MYTYIIVCAWTTYTYYYSIHIARGAERKNNQLVVLFFSSVYCIHALFYHKSYTHPPERSRQCWLQIRELWTYATHRRTLVNNNNLWATVDNRQHTHICIISLVVVLINWVFTPSRNSGLHMYQYNKFLYERVSVQYCW